MTGRILAFDSGIGGLSVVRALRLLQPAATIDYLADNAVFPYGELPDAHLVERVSTVIGAALARFAPDVVVVACNTASTVALAELRRRFATPFVGCVPPIKWASEVSRTRHIGLLATSATVRRPYLRELQQRFARDCTLVAHGARGLADIAEAAFRHRTIDRDAVRLEIERLFAQPGADRIDVVGIGCTHYSFLLETLRSLSPPGITWLDPAAAVARRTCAVLAELELCPVARSAGNAWFTASPHDPARLQSGLAVFGYDRMLAFEVGPRADAAISAAG